MLGLHVLSKLGRIPLHCTKECEKGVRVIFPRLDFRVMHLTPGVPAELGEGLRVQAFDVEHSSATRTMGLRFTDAGGHSLAYMPDLGALPGSKLARNADIAFVDGSTRSRPVRGHLAMEQIVAAAKRLQAGRLLFTHIGHRTGTHAELSEWLPAGADVAYDGLRIEL
jgi:ribonuclease BN (tRNA processing enzyme)